MRLLKDVWLPCLIKGDTNDGARARSFRTAGTNQQLIAKCVCMTGVLVFDKYIVIFFHTTEFGTFFYAMLMNEDHGLLLPASQLTTFLNAVKCIKFRMSIFEKKVKPKVNLFNH